MFGFGSSGPNELGPFALQHVCLWLERVDTSKELIQLSLELLPEFCGIFWLENTLALESLLVELRHRGSIADLLVHLWLGVSWLVQLVVSPASVTDQVDDHVFAEHLAIPECHIHSAHHRLWMVAIDVENWASDCLTYVGGIYARPSEVSRGSVSYIVVHDDMDRAATAIVRKT